MTNIVGSSEVVLWPVDAGALVVLSSLVVHGCDL